MSKRQRKRRRTSDHLPFGVVLRAVARALELVFSLVPRDDATQVRAHRAQAVVSQSAVRLHDEVRRVALQALRQRVIARQVRLQPSGSFDVIALRILCGLTGTTTAGAVKHGNEREVSDASSRERSRNSEISPSVVAYPRDRDVGDLVAKTCATLETMHALAIACTRSRTSGRHREIMRDNAIPRRASSSVVRSA